MGVKLARAMGAEVVVFTTSERKRADALALGAHGVILSTDPAAMTQQLGSFDFILDTVSAPHDLNAYLEHLKLDGSMVLVGAPAEPIPLGVFSLIFKRRRLAGSAIGGIRETQEMLDFCAAHGIAVDIELIPASKLDEAYARLLKSDVKYRFVIDCASLR
jgi:uncharacterized zinc-type alcohol dehydrogenase-like protein